MSTTVIPTMHLSASYLTDPKEKVVYVLRHFTSIPSGISNTFSDEEISMQRLRARYGHNAQTMAKSTKDELLSVLERTFPDDKVTVECEPKYSDEVRYDLEISVFLTNKNGNMEYVSGDITVTSDGQIQLELNEGE